MQPSLITCTKGTLTVAVKTEVFRLQDLICRWVVQDGLGVNTSLVSESTLPMVLAGKSKAEGRTESRVVRIQ
jgi:hypothetical protein